MTGVEGVGKAGVDRRGRSGESVFRPASAGTKEAHPAIPLVGRRRRSRGVPGGFKSSGRRWARSAWLVAPAVDLYLAIFDKAITRVATVDAGRKIDWSPLHENRFFRRETSA